MSLERAFAPFQRFSSAFWQIWGREEEGGVERIRSQIATLKRDAKAVQVSDDQYKSDLEITLTRKAVEAIQEGADVELIKLLIEEGADPNGRTEKSSGYTLFQYTLSSVAADEYSLNSIYEMVDFMLSKGADVNARNPRQSNYTSVMTYIIGVGTELPWDDGRILKRLLQANPDLSLTAVDGSNVFHTLYYLTGFKQAPVFRILVGLEEGAGAGAGAGVRPELLPLINKQNIHGTPPLWISCHHRKSTTEFIHELLKAGADPNIPRGEDGTLIRYLIANGRSLIGEGREEVNSITERVRLLIQYGADPNGLDPASQNPILLLAIKKKLYTTALAILASPTLEVDKPNPSNGETALLGACLYNTDHIARLPEQKTARIDLVNRLIDLGANVNAKDSLGNTSVMCVASSYASAENDALARRLLDKGADVNAVNSSNTSPLQAMMGTWGGSPEMCKLFLERGAVADHRDDEGTTALMWAARNAEKCVPLLIAAGANLNLQNNPGHTALMYATLGTNFDSFRYLIRAGADVTLVTSAGRNLLDMLVSPNNWKALLVEYEMIDEVIAAGLPARLGPAKQGRPLLTFLLEYNPDTAPVGYASLVDRLIANRKVDVTLKDAVGFTAIHSALAPFLTKPEVQNPFLAARIQRLIDRGCNVNDVGGVNQVQAIVMAAQTGSYDVMNVLLAAGADAKVPDALHMAVFTSGKTKDDRVVKQLLAAGADPMTRNLHDEGTPAAAAFGLKGALAPPDSVVLMILNAMTTVNVQFPEMQNWSPLHFAAARGNKDLVELLLSKGADRTLRTATGQLPEDVATGEARKILAKKWKGYTKEDIELFNTLFKDPKDYATEVAATPPGQPPPPPIRAEVSMCPICLSYTLRADGCMYMTHICPMPRHEPLYDKYKKPSDNTIEWCTACGRITQSHKHYKQADPDDPKPGFAPTTPAGGWEFSDKYCMEAGGGGYKEKIKRFNRLIEHAGKLQSKIGVLTDEDARMELVEEMWRAARGRLLTDDEIEEIVKARSFKIPESFNAPSAAPTSEAESAYPDVQRPEDEREFVPKQHNPPENDCIVEFGPHEDGRPVWQFFHKQPNGSIYDHTYIEGANIGAGGGGERVTQFICGPHLEAALRSNEITGKCPIDPERCQGLIYPEEIKGIVSESWYETYRKKFNEARQGQRGGGGETAMPILRPVDDSTAECVVVPRPSGTQRLEGGNRRRTHRRRRYSAS